MTAEPASRVIPPATAPNAAGGDGPSAGSAYQRVAGQLRGLIPLLGTGSAAALIERCYALLSQESLMFACGQRPGRASRLNADGTPFQFALTLGRPDPPLQFLAETGAPPSSSAERMSADRDRIRWLAGLCGADGFVPGVDALLDELVPPGDAELLADPAGAIWLGMSFPPAGRPSLKIYVNAKWGRMPSRWARLAAFCAHAGFPAGGREIRQVTGGELEPLGISLTVSATSAGGRVYLSGYGQPYSYYEMLGGIYGGPAFREHLRRYGTALLEEDYAYPTRSVVCSLGIRPGLPADFKVELCGHCAFGSDVQARARCAGWLRRSRSDLALYLSVVKVLSGGQLSTSGSPLHAYLGTGSGRGEPYSTFYFNPAAVAC
jgi:hypothetical protein